MKNNNGNTKDQLELVKEYENEVEQAIKKELETAVLKFGIFINWHQAYAVLLEEVDELWAEIKNKDGNLLNIYQEAIQVSAMSKEIAMQALLTIKNI